MPGPSRCSRRAVPAFAAVETLKAEGLTTLQAIDRLAGDAAGAETEQSETTETQGDVE